MGNRGRSTTSKYKESCGSCHDERGEPDLKTSESLLISLPLAIMNSYCKSQFCHVDTAWSTILSRGWLCLWLKATVWAVAVRSLLQCCDRNPQKGQTCTQSLLEAFLTTVHPQIIGVHSTGKRKDGNNKQSPLMDGSDVLQGHSMKLNSVACYA